MRNSSLLAALPLVLFLSVPASLPAGEAAPAAAAAPRPPAATLKAAGSGTSKVDAAGFIRRWLVLEPLAVNGRLTEDEVEKVLPATASAPGVEAVPRAGDVVDANNVQRKWHALDTSKYNLNTYHFAWALSKPTSNVMFEVATVVEAPREMRDVRLAICSNAASVWWLNGERLIGLYNDRQAVIDDGVSRRVTLRKGANVVRGVVVNAGGATDFCGRFLDSKDEPIKDLVVRLPGN